MAPAQMFASAPTSSVSSSSRATDPHLRAARTKRCTPMYCFELRLWFRLRVPLWVLFLVHVLTLWYGRVGYLRPLKDLVVTPLICESW
jgi:hypothetical protein